MNLPVAFDGNYLKDANGQTVADLRYRFGRPVGKDIARAVNAHTPLVRIAELLEAHLLEAGDPFSGCDQELLQQTRAALALARKRE